MSTTTQPTIQTTVGELVTQQPGRSRVFDKLGLDYCCGGKKSLAEACGAKGLDATAVLRNLLEADGITAGHEDTDWSQASLTALCDHIEKTHHAYLKKELPRLGALVRKVAAVHGGHHPWTLEIDGIYASFAAEMESHMMKEDQILFPLIRTLDSKSQNSPGAKTGGPSVTHLIRVMEHEHDDAGQAMEKIRQLSSDFTPPPDACNTFRAMLDGLVEIEADTHRHVHKENSILFPRALATEEQNSAQGR